MNNPTTFAVGNRVKHNRYDNLGTIVAMVDNSTIRVQWDSLVNETVCDYHITLVEETKATSDYVVGYISENLADFLTDIKTARAINTTAPKTNK